MADLSRHPRLLALLEAARHCPHEDTPRLVLADWLEEHGDPDRAGFIRTQLLLAPASPPLEAGRRADALLQEQTLLDRFGGGWLGPLWRHGGVWHRGLLCVRLDRLRVPT